MKISSLPFAIFAAVALASCGSGSDETSMKEGSVPTTTVDERDTMAFGSFVNNYDELRGKEVILQGYSWGDNEGIDGKILVGFAAIQIEPGLTQTLVALIFKASDKAKVQAIEFDEEITVRATVGGRSSEVILLENPVLLK